MVIPDAAVEAAAAKMPPIWTGSPAYRANLVQALEAAAPYIAAQAWDDGQQAWEDELLMKRSGTNPYRPVR